MRLRPDETELVGHWKHEGGKFLADDTSQKIVELVREWLKFVARTSDGWEQLLRYPLDGRFWELTYPTSEMHGGGPPALRVISEDVARSKYGIKA